MSSLLEEGIQRLRDNAHRQCKSTLKRGEMVCAEGIFAELLVQHQSDRFSFLRHGGGASSLLDAQDPDNNFVILHKEQWDELHPQGYWIASRAAMELGGPNIASANDELGKTFPQIADALQDSLYYYTEPPF